MIIIAKKKKIVKRERLKTIYREDYKISEIERTTNIYHVKKDPNSKPFNYHAKIYLKKGKKWDYDATVHIPAKSKGEFLNFSKDFIRLPKYRQKRYEKLEKERKKKR